MSSRDNREDTFVVPFVEDEDEELCTGVAGADAEEFSSRATAPRAGDRIIIGDDLNVVVDTDVDPSKRFSPIPVNFSRVL